MSKPKSRVVYLHGFNSSPASLKARLFVEYCHSRGIEANVPTLSYDPELAMKTAGECIRGQQNGSKELPALLVGSSLGGYYATWFTEQLGVPSVLINPAVSPCDHLQSEFLGNQRNYHSGEAYEFTLEHVNSLRRLDVASLRDPRKYLLLVQTGDEVLDYRLAVQHYQGAKQIVQEGGSHMYDNFAAMLPTILQFAGFQ